MKRFWFRLLLACTFFISVLFVDFLLELRERKNIIKTTEKSNSIYLLGTSRVMRGLNPDIFQSEFSNYRVFNAAAPSCTFLFTSQIARELMHRSDSNIYLIEFTIVKEDIPFSVLKHMQFLGMSKSTMYSDLNWRKYSQWKKLFHHELACYSIQNQLKGNEYNPLRQFRSSDLCRGHENSLMDMEDITSGNREPVNPRHLSIVEELLSLATQTHSKIYFFLPFVSDEKWEYEEVVPVFNQLPDSVKVSFSPEFVSSIHDTTLLYDNNHHNFRGAVLISEYFCKTLSGALK